MTLEFSKPRFIQRIERPWGNSASGPLNPIGFSKDADAELGKVMSFDYMGSAEFEFGALPRCLRSMWDGREKLVTMEVSIQVHPPYLWPQAAEEASKLGWKKGEMPPEEVEIFVLLPESMQLEFYYWALEHLPNDCEKTRLQEALKFQASAYLSRWLKIECKELDYFTKTVAWLDIRNHAFWTIDRQMFDQVCKLFDIRRPLENWSAKAA